MKKSTTILGKVSISVSIQVIRLSISLPHYLIFQGLLGPKKELWDLLQKVEKFDTDASDITASVRDLPTVRYQHLDQ